MIRHHSIINYLIASVWLINGVFCKLLDWVPRHEAIIGRIVGTSHARLFAILIGVAETLMAAWIVSGMTPRLNAITQIIVIAAMNILEYFLVPDLLLWGRFNAIFALLLIIIIYTNTFKSNRKTSMLS